LNPNYQQRVVCLERDVDALLSQLDLNSSFFLELVLIGILFLILSRVLFQPFLRLFEIRRKRTIEDKETAETLMHQATAKLEEYQRLISEERISAKKEFDLSLADARKQEAQILSRAREEARKMILEAADLVHQQRDQLQKQLESDVHSFAQLISEKLLSERVEPRNADQ
jgi:F0F1-type ATP synthase membrane subunit b/b'